MKNTAVHTYITYRMFNWSWCHYLKLANVCFIFHLQNDPDILLYSCVVSQNFVELYHHYQTKLLVVWIAISWSLCTHYRCYNSTVPYLYYITLCASTYVCVSLYIYLCFRAIPMPLTNETTYQYATRYHIYESTYRHRPPRVRGRRRQRGPGPWPPPGEGATSAHPLDPALKVFISEYDHNIVCLPNFKQCTVWLTYLLCNNNLLLFNRERERERMYVYMS